MVWGSYYIGHVNRLIDNWPMDKEFSPFSYVDILTPLCIMCTLPYIAHKVQVPPSPTHIFSVCTSRSPVIVIKVVNFRTKLSQSTDD